jgi:hypothetical protein
VIDGERNIGHADYAIVFGQNLGFAKLIGTNVLQCDIGAVAKDLPISMAAETLAEWLLIAVFSRIVILSLARQA